MTCARADSAGLLNVLGGRQWNHGSARDPSAREASKGSNTGEREASTPVVREGWEPSR